MSDSVAGDLVVLPPVFDDPIFRDLSGDELALDDSRRIGADPHDFAGLFIKHKWSFQLHARRFLSDQRDIDEVVQEGFLKLFLAMPELETELHALAYARRTITNLCIDRYRADQRRPRLIDLESLPFDAFVDEDDTDPLIQAEDAATVREALALLSPLHRAALIKREIEEKPLPQIAAELDIPVEQVKHVLHRARRSLRRLLVGTHVEPGVELDWTLVMQANRVRAASAAKPTGAAVLAVLLILAGFLGVRSGGNKSPRTLDVAHAGSPRGLLGGTVPTITPTQPRSAAQAVTSAVSPPATARPRTPRHPKAPVSAPRTPSKVVPAPASPAVAARPAAKPPVTNAPTTGRPAAAVRPAAARAFVVTGIGGSGVGTVTDQQRDLAGSGTTSRSTFMASTRHGAYSLKQAYTFAADGSLAGVSIAETVPIEVGAVGTIVNGTSTNVLQQSDGAVAIITAGVASPIDPVNGQTVAPRLLTVNVVLAADHLSVLSEQITVQPSASDSANSSQAASDAVPDSGATAAPTPTPTAPAPVPSPTPTAPQPTAGQTPSPLAVTEPSRSADAAVPAPAGATP